MELSNYPILIITMAIIFYLFGKKKKKDVVIEKLIPQELNDFSNESEEEFTERCFKFLNEWFKKNEILAYNSSDKKSFRIGFEEADGSFVDYFIETFFSANKKIMMFHTKFAVQIPDNKLNEISEFVNRMNHNLLVGALYLNYETRTVESRLVYYVGNSELDSEQLEFNYGMLLGVKIKSSILKIIEGHENPAIVAMDWPN